MCARVQCELADWTLMIDWTDWLHFWSVFADSLPVCFSGVSKSPICRQCRQYLLIGIFWDFGVGTVVGGVSANVFCGQHFQTLPTLNSLKALYRDFFSNFVTCLTYRTYTLRLRRGVCKGVSANCLLWRDLMFSQTDSVFWKSADTPDSFVS